MNNIICSNALIGGWRVSNFKRHGRHFFSAVPK